MSETPETAPGELAVRLATSLTEFLDYFRSNDTDYGVPREQYAQDVIDADVALADFDEWAGGGPV